MPRLVQDIAQFLPFQLFKYVPIEIVLNRLTPGELALDFASGAVWLVIMLLLFSWTWREGIKRFSAVGA